VRPRKKIKGAKTQETGKSRKKLKIKEKIPFSGIFLGQKEKKQSDNLHEL